MTATSANGWPVLFDQAQTKTWTLPVKSGAHRHLILAPGAPGFILAHFALWFHEKIEPLNEGVYDDWGWAVRPIRGQTSGYSNHASGTAEDLNATVHPLGQKGTFAKAWMYLRIKAKVLVYGGAIRWGGTWSRPDEMHFEIAAGRDKVHKVAKRLRDSKRGRRIRKANP